VKRAHSPLRVRVCVYAFAIARENTTSISLPEFAPVLMWNCARLASTSAFVSDRLTPEFSEALLCRYSWVGTGRPPLKH
jgi:hypothetical protein